MPVVTEKLAVLLASRSAWGGSSPRRARPTSPLRTQTAAVSSLKPQHCRAGDVQA